MLVGEMMFITDDVYYYHQNFFFPFKSVAFMAFIPATGFHINIFHKDSFGTVALAHTRYTNCEALFCAPVVF